MKVIAFLIGIIALVALSVWWQIYAYHDCKNVGHSTLYCVMRVGT
jgi:hypothetical protein